MSSWADLGVRLALGREPRALRLLGGEQVLALDRELAHRLLCREQLPAGPLTEPLGPKRPNM